MVITWRVNGRPPCNIYMYILVFFMYLIVWKLVSNHRSYIRLHETYGRREVFVLLNIHRN